MTSDDSRAGRRDGATRPPGTVAEEAARLVDLLSLQGWGAPARDHARDHARDQARDRGPATPDASDEAGPGVASGSGPSGPSEPSDASAPRSGAACTCGGSTPAACRVCPVCQLIAFVQRIEPDAIERVADVVGFAATALRDLATAQRARRERDEHGADAAAPQAKPGPDAGQDAPTEP